MAASYRQKRWLTLTSDAALRVVAAANYLRYGPQGVRRFGPNATRTGATQPQQITIQLTAKSPADVVRFQQDHWTLHHHDPSQPFDLEGRTLWVGHHAEAQLRIAWVWDFYRMYSGIKLDVQIPVDVDKANATLRNHSAKAPDTAGDLWRSTYTQINAVEPGDQLVVSVTSASGNLLQVYPIHQPPAELNNQN